MKSLALLARLLLADAHFFFAPAAASLDLSKVPVHKVGSALAPTLQAAQSKLLTPHGFLWGRICLLPIPITTAQV